MLQIQHLLVVTPSWGCGGRLLSGAHFLGVAEEAYVVKQPEMAGHTPQLEYLALFLQCSSALRLSIPSRQ